jgi:hypothetical protein
VLEQTRTEFHIDPVGGVSEHVGSQRAKHGLKYGDGDQTDHQHVKRRKPPVGQYFIGHDLKKQGCCQSKELQEERCDQYLAQKVPVFVHSLNKPGNIEPARHIRERCASRH